MRTTTRFFHLAANTVFSHPIQLESLQLHGFVFLPSPSTLFSSEYSVHPRKMKLHVQVMEARNLMGRDPNGLSDPFVRLQLGSTKAKSSVVSKNLNPMWYEDFYFNVGDLDEELTIAVWDQDRVFDDFLGQLKIPVAVVLDADKQSLPAAWYTLLKKSEKSKNLVSGEILLGFSLYGRASSSQPHPQVHPSPHLMSRPPETLHIRTSSLDSDSSETDSVLALDSPFASPEPSRFHLSSPLGDSPAIGSPDLGSPRYSDSGTPKFHLDGSRFGLEAPRVASPSPLGDHHSVFTPDSAKNSDASSVERNRKTRRRSFGRFTGLFATRRSQPSMGAASSPSERSSVDAHVISDQSVSSELSGDEGDNHSEAEVPMSFFEDDGISDVDQPGITEPIAEEDELTPPLPGGVVLDQSYGVSAKTLNGLLFKPGSEFVRDVTEAQKTTEVVEQPWIQRPGEPMRRVVTYVKAATKIVKSVKATEEQTYVKVDAKGFVMLMIVSTPDVPFGDTFKTEIQMIIKSGPRLPNGEKTSHLNISWRVNFDKKPPMLRAVIENGARQGIRDTYLLYGQVLSKYAQPVKNLGVARLNSLDDLTPKSDWEAAYEYFGNLPVLLCLLSLALMLLHIRLARPGVRKLGLEFWWFDFPDTCGELITAAIVVLQVEHVGKMMYRFLRARYLRASDHGVKAQGDGWLLTVTLLEGDNLPAADQTGYSDPYVVFTCNGKIRTSSVKLQTLNPQWREIFEFDATEDPPSTMDVEVFDYEGPLSEPESLGHAEINFLKMTPDQLADLWLPLSGKKENSSGAKLHLRVFYTNTKESVVQPEYLEKVEKEAKTKIGKRSPQSNTSFQRLFSLPEEEFLINDFACAVKKKIPLQGRMFLSPRMLGFYSNIFGHKTKFSLLWEDIEEIKELTPSLSSVGALFNPSIVIFVRKGRGMDAKQGARRTDNLGRLKFQFLSFVRPGPAFRTIIALGKNRTLSPEQQMEIVASVEDGDMKYAVAGRQADDDAAFLGVEDAKMTEVASLEVPITVEEAMALFVEEKLDERVMAKAGCLNYKATPWEPVVDKPHVERRQVSYKYCPRLCRFGSAVTCAQQKTVAEDKKTLIVEEILTLHDVPFGDHFQVQVRKECETVSTNPPQSVCKVFLGVAWQKSTVFEKRITKNIHENIVSQIKDIMDLTAKEIKLKKKDGSTRRRGTKRGG